MNVFLLMTFVSSLCFLSINTLSDAYLLVGKRGEYTLMIKEKRIPYSLKICTVWLQWIEYKAKTYQLKGKLFQNQLPINFNFKRLILIPF